MKGTKDKKLTADHCSVNSTNTIIQFVFFLYLHLNQFTNLKKVQTKPSLSSTKGKSCSAPTLSLSQATPRAVSHSHPSPCSSPPFSVCPSHRRPAFSQLHLLSCPLLRECWGVEGAVHGLVIPLDAH